KLSQGAGLGLYIVKQAVDKLGGVLMLDSEEGIGTTFSITIPLQNQF
ncbi:MAG: ATP-binding protein, partial [Chryseotalea sp.]